MPKTSDVQRPAEGWEAPEEAIKRLWCEIAFIQDTGISGLRADVSCADLIAVLEHNQHLTNVAAPVPPPADEGMVEAMARAMARAAGQDPDGVSSGAYTLGKAEPDQVYQRFWQLHLGAAYAALSVLPPASPAGQAEPAGWRPDREAVARIIDPVAFEERPVGSVGGAGWARFKRNALAKADAILALASPPSEPGQ